MQYPSRWDLGADKPAKAKCPTPAKLWFLNFPKSRYIPIKAFISGKANSAQVIQLFWMDTQGAIIWFTIFFYSCHEDLLYTRWRSIQLLARPSVDCGVIIHQQHEQCVAHTHKLLTHTECEIGSSESELLNNVIEMSKKVPIELEIYLSRFGLNIASPRSSLAECMQARHANT